MKHIVINNLGPIKHAEVDVKQLNIVIGPQSSGKSCLLKAVCFCCWLEKRIELTQNTKLFKDAEDFLDKLVSFHNMHNYIRQNTNIAYESDFLKFSCDSSDNTFKCEWKEGNRWNYSRTKISYIPAERIIIGAVQNMLRVDFSTQNLKAFVADWEDARRAVGNELEILNLGVTYTYNPDLHTDKINVGKGIEATMSEVSSGLQSLIPLFVYITYLTKGLYERIQNNLERGEEAKRLIRFLLEEKYKIEGGRIDIAQPKGSSVINVNIMGNETLDDYLSEKDRAEIIATLDRYRYTDHCDIFLEEPEENLFPVAQSDLVEWLYDNVIFNKKHSLFVTTHSPYILTSFLEKDYHDINLLFINEEETGNTVETATPDEIQRIYDNGVDAFFNISSLK